MALTMILKEDFLQYIVIFHWFYKIIFYTAFINVQYNWLKIPVSGI